MELEWKEIGALVTEAPRCLGAGRGGGGSRESLQKREARVGIPLEKGAPGTIQGLRSIREAKRNKDHCLLHTRMCLECRYGERQILEGFICWAIHLVQKKRKDNPVVRKIPLEKQSSSR